MSLCSASTAGARAAAAWSSTVCSSLRPVTSRCATAASLPGTSHGRPHQCRLLRAGIRRAWPESPPGVRGALRICHTPAKWRARSRQMTRCTLPGQGTSSDRGNRAHAVSIHGPTQAHGHGVAASNVLAYSKCWRSADVMSPDHHRRVAGQIGPPDPSSTGRRGCFRWLPAASQDPVGIPLTVIGDRLHRMCPSPGGRPMTPGSSASSPGWSSATSPRP